MDFQVGDKVVCLLKGPGVVFAVENDSNYSIEVSFGNGTSDLYTKLGYLYDNDEFPCLYHEGTEVHVKPAEPQRYPWVNIYCNGLSAETGPPYSTKEKALEKKRPEGYWKLVDTIQLKPKEDE